MKRSPQPFKKTTSNVWMSRTVVPKVRQLFDSASDHIITIDDSLDMATPSVQIICDTFDNNNNDQIESLPSQMPYIASASQEGGEEESSSSNNSSMVRIGQQCATHLDDIVTGSVIAPILSQDDGAWDVSFFTDLQKEQQQQLPSVGNSPSDSEDDSDDADFTQVINKLEPIRAFGSVISSLGETALTSKTMNNSIKSRRREAIREACSKLRSRMNQSISVFESEILSAMDME